MVTFMWLLTTVCYQMNPENFSSCGRKIAHCALIPYWSKRLNKKDMIAMQLSKRGGVIYCSYLNDRVNMGGEAITYMQGEILLDNI